MEASMAAFKFAAVLLAGTLIAASPAHAQGRRLIYVENACSRPARIIFMHTDSARGARQQGWYYFNPGEASYLRSPAGDKLTQIEDQPLYAYAETTDTRGKLHWQGDGPEVKLDGGIYRTMQMSTRVDVDGDLLTRLTCD
jgi:hypothetical protein